MSHPIRHFAIVAVLALLGALVFGPGLSGGYIFDDHPNLVDDPDWKLQELSISGLLAASGEGIAGFGGRPLAMATFAINHAFTGMDPWPIKATNLAMHVVTAMLIYALMVTLLTELRAKQRPAPPVFIGSLLIALAWLVHPIQVSTVLYAVQRMEIGAALCTVASLLAYSQARVREIAGERSPGRYVVAALLAAAALGFKETAILAPVLAGLLELFVFRFRAHGRLHTPLLSTYLVLASAAALAFVFLVVPTYLSPGAYAFRDFTLTERLASQASIVAHYLAQLALPAPDRLVFYYDHLRPWDGMLSGANIAWATLFHSAMITLALLAARALPCFALGVAWFYVCHSLTSNVVPLELAFEHRNYLASAGFCLAVASLLSWLGQKLGRIPEATAATAWILGLAFLSILHSATWGNSLQLATALASRNLESPRATYALASHLYDLSAGDPRAPAWSMALDEFRHASELPLSSPLGEQGQIIMLARAEKPIPEEVWDSFRRKLTRRSIAAQELGSVFAVVNCRIRDQCTLDDQQLLLTLQVALTANPHSPALHVQYANFAFAAMGDQELAIRMVMQAVKLAPGQRTYRDGLTELLLASNLHELDGVAQEALELLGPDDRESMTHRLPEPHSDSKEVEDDKPKPH